MQLLLLLVVALTITVALIPPLANAAGRFRLLDRPGERKVHAAPMPRIGGIAMAIGTLVPLIVMASQPGEWAVIYLGVAILLVMGLLDDRHDLAWPWKLGALVVACALAVGAGGVSIESATLTERIELPMLVSTALSLVFLVGVTNAINLSDGLDGLAGGTTLLSVIAIGWISFSTGNVAVAATTAALTGALLGFLRFNTHPARVFMGDSGSQVLGFLAGVVAIKATQGTESTVSAALPMLLLAWPILDTLTVMIERIRDGRSPFSADRRHFHHRLLSLGFDHYQAVLIIYAVQCALFVLVFLLRFESDVVIGATFVAFAALTIGSLEGARFVGWRWERAERQPSRIAKKVRWLAQNDVVARTCRVVLLIALGGYGAVVAAAPLPVSMDIAALALTLAAILAFVAVSGKRMTSVIRCVCFVAAAMLVYLDHRELGALQPDSPLVLLLFGAIGIAVLLRFRVSGERRFAFTTLDALVLFVALMAPVFVGEVSSGNVGFGILKLVALGYALEFAFEGDEPARGSAWMAALLLAVVALRGIVDVAQA